MKRTFFFLLSLLLMIFSLTACGFRDAESGSLDQTEGVNRESSTALDIQRTADEQNLKSEETVTEGTKTYRGFVLDNVLHSQTEGDIHYNLYLPASCDGSIPYALFVTLPGYEGLYFQGVGANLRAEAYGFEAQNYNREMIVVAPQLDDWGETSANQTIVLTEYLLSHYNIDPQKVYLHGMSGGGETGSLVMGKRPELFAAYLATSTQWDGDLEVLAQARVPVYLAVGEDDSYYGSAPLKEAYAQLHGLYEEQGLSEDEIGEILVLDIKGQDYFSKQGYSDQHAGGLAFAFDEEIMGWLFAQ